MSPTIAVIYATRGGLGDVGKYTAVHALAQKEWSVRVVAMSMESSEGTDNGIEVDIKDQEAVAELKRSFEGVDILKLDVENGATQTRLEEVFDGVDAVVACLGNRQPSMARWCALGAEKVASAMKTKGVKRLVLMSSMGIGQDFQPISCIRLLWSCLLRTLIRSGHQDLIAMEDIIQESDLDYVLVRPTGLSPEEVPKGTWHLRQSWDDDKFTSVAVAKSDVAMFMVNEAINPTLHRTAVTIGQKDQSSK